MSDTTNPNGTHGELICVPSEGCYDIVDTHTGEVVAMAHDLPWAALMCASGELMSAVFDAAVIVKEIRDTPLMDISPMLDELELALARGLAKLAAEADA